MKYNNRFVAIDTETGGLPNKNKVATIDVALTEIAMVSACSESLEILDKVSWLIQPYDPDLEYNPRAAEVSGINKQLCEQEGLDIETVYKNSSKFLKSNKVGSKKPIVIMQNKSFDIPFLENLFSIFKDDFNKYVERFEDTLHWSRVKFVELPNFKLGTIANESGIELTEAHRALPDTISTMKIWLHFIKCLRCEGGSGNKQESVNKVRNGFKF